jgi:hypothetical protein
LWDSRKGVGCTKEGCTWKGEENHKGETTIIGFKETNATRVDNIVARVWTLDCVGMFVFYLLYFKNNSLTISTIFILLLLLQAEERQSAQRKAEHRLNEERKLSNANMRDVVERARKSEVDRDLF